MKFAPSFLKKSFPVAALLALFATACSDVYYEKPVPQSGEALRSTPPEWTGLYVVEPDPTAEVSVFEEIFRSCFRFESLGNGNLLISAETRIHEQDLPKLKEALEVKKKEGKLLDYQMTESTIFCRLKTEEEGQIGVEDQFTTLLKTGAWYVLTQTVQPYWLFDFENSKRFEYEPERKASVRTEWMPAADSMSVKSTQLVARQKQKTWYFNTRKDEDPGWSLICVEQDAKDMLAVKLSNLNDRKMLEERADYYNAITPFRQEGDNRYMINPTDAALDRLMREESLFQTIRLRKVE